MDQEPRTAGQAVAAHPDGATRDPAEIRRDVERSREELGDTVAALAAKADVKTRAREKVDDVKHSVTGTRDELAGRAKRATPDSASAAAGQVAGAAQQYRVPLMIVAGVAVGFVAGWLLSSR